MILLTFNFAARWSMRAKAYWGGWRSSLLQGRCNNGIQVLVNQILGFLAVFYSYSVNLFYGVNSCYVFSSCYGANLCYGVNLQGVFFTEPPPKKFKYGNLG